MRRLENAGSTKKAGGPGAVFAGGDRPRPAPPAPRAPTPANLYRFVPHWMTFPGRAVPSPAPIAGTPVGPKSMGRTANGSAEERRNRTIDAGAKRRKIPPPGFLSMPARRKKSARHHLVGAHVSIAGGHDKALYRAESIGCEIVQVFTKNNMQWSAKPLTLEAIDAFHKARKENGFDHVFAHSGYLINLAATDPKNLERSRQSLLDELTRCAQLDLPFIVLHPGAHMGAGENAGLKRVTESIDHVLRRYEGDTRIALEITAGQGSCLGARIEHLGAIIEHAAQPERLAVCLDTCHMFAAGYDVRTRRGIDAFVQEFRKHLPWESVVCVHINDSKGSLGSRVDRHELLGRGKIGWECFRVLLHHKAFAKIPLCLETPKGKDNLHDIETLQKLKSARVG